MTLANMTSLLAAISTAVLLFVFLLFLSRSLRRPGRRKEDPVLAYLRALFTAHGAPCALSRDGASLVFPARPYQLFSHVEKVKRVEDRHVLELVVALELSGRDRAVVETFAGWGETRDEALDQAFTYFTQSAFHVWLAAFFGIGDYRVTEEEWLVAGKAKRAYAGEMVTIGRFPAGGILMTDVFPALEAAVKSRPMEDNSHWLRFFFAQVKEGQRVCQVLLDNEPWPDVREEMERFPWPESDNYYSIRQFTVFRDPDAPIPPAPTSR